MKLDDGDAAPVSLIVPHVVTVALGVRDVVIEGVVDDDCERLFVRLSDVV